MYGPLLVGACVAVHCSERVFESGEVRFGRLYSNGKCGWCTHSCLLLGRCLLLGMSVNRGSTVNSFINKNSATPICAIAYPSATILCKPVSSVGCAQLRVAAELTTKQSNYFHRLVRNLFWPFSDKINFLNILMPKVCTQLSDIST